MRDNLELFARLAGLKGVDRSARMDEVADVLELGAFMDRPVRFLSDGAKRRLHTAMALVHHPKVLLLDEPTTGVDIATRSRLLSAIRDLAAAEGCAVLYSTHYLPEVEELGASVAILDRGRILTRGPLAELVGEFGIGMVELTLAWTRMWALAQHDLRILRRDPAFLVIFTIVPLAFMAFNKDSFAAALSVEFAGRGFNGSEQIVPGAAVLFSGFLVGNLGFSVFREHGWGTWDRLRASQLSTPELLVTKSVALTPVEFLPGWARFIAPATPAYWAMRGFRSVLFDGEGLAAVALPVAILLGFSAVFNLIAVRRFRIEEAKVSWA